MCKMWKTFLRRCALVPLFRVAHWWCDKQENSFTHGQVRLTHCYYWQIELLFRASAVVENALKKKPLYLICSVPISCDLCDAELANGQELQDHLESKSHWDTMEHIQKQSNYNDVTIAFLQVGKHTRRDYHPVNHLTTLTTGTLLCQGADWFFFFFIF